MKTMTFEYGMLTPLLCNSTALALKRVRPSLPGSGQAGSSAHKQGCGRLLRYCKSPVLCQKPCWSRASRMAAPPRASSSSRAESRCCMSCHRDACTFSAGWFCRRSCSWQKFTRSKAHTCRAAGGFRKSFARPPAEHTCSVQCGAARARRWKFVSVMNHSHIEWRWQQAWICIQHQRRALHAKGFTSSLRACCSASRRSSFDSCRVWLIDKPEASCSLTSKGCAG